MALSDAMTFDIDYAGGALDLSAPHLKVLFTTDGEKTGSLLSVDIPPIPEHGR